MAAYIVTTNGKNFYKLAGSDAVKNFHDNNDNTDSFSISDSDYTALKNAEKEVLSIASDNTVTYITRLGETDTPSTMTQDATQSYIDSVKTLLQTTINHRNDHPLYTEINNYYNYLNGIDLSTISWPITGTWEKYCADNSISFVNPSEI